MNSLGLLEGTYIWMHMNGAGVDYPPCMHAPVVRACWCVLIGVTAWLFAWLERFKSRAAQQAPSQRRLRVVEVR